MIGEATTVAKRPVIRYHGGKWMLAPWVLSYFPEHRIYTETYGGAASVLMRKARAYSEVYNDMDSEIVNLFRVLRDEEKARELCRLLWLTPFAREEFVEAYQQETDPIMQARQVIIRAFMGFGSQAATSKSASSRGFRMPAKYKVKPDTGFRANSNRSGTVPAHDWAHYPECLRAFVERLRGVTIENRPALEIIRQHDTPETLHYVDPPYPETTRKAGQVGNYRHEMTDDDHRALAAELHGVAGMVVLSGYACPLYDRELYPDWRRVTCKSLADGARPRIECLWLSPSTDQRLQRMGGLFGEHAQAVTP